jgi:hypothetical protein
LRCSPRVAGEVVQLGERQLHVFLRAPQHARERRPATVGGGGQRLEVERGGRGGRAHRPRQQAVAGQVRGRRARDRIEDRGHDVVVAGHGVHDRRRHDRRREQDQRNAQRRLVGEKAVCTLTVLAEALAMVGGQDDDGVGRGRLQERPQHGLEGRVRGRHLAHVRRARETRREGFPRQVRGMRVVHVDPAEGRTAVALGQPALGRGDGVCATALGQGQRPRRPLELVVVYVEAAIEAEARVERERAHERPRAIAGRLQERGQGGRVGGKPEPRVVAHAVLEGEAAGQDVGVRGQGDDVVRVRLAEHHASAGQAIEDRRGARGGAVRAHRVRAQGVDRDQQDVEALLPGEGGDGTSRVQRGRHREGGPAEHQGEEDGRTPPPRPRRLRRRGRWRGSGRTAPAGACHGKKKARGTRPGPVRTILECHPRPH